MNSEEQRLKRKHSYAYLLVLSIFSAACFFAAFFMALKAPGTSVLGAKLPPGGGEVGPLEVDRDNSVYTITVSENLSLYGSSTWSFVEGELLDANKEFLMGFGDEMWKERDSEGTYQNTEYELSLTIAEKGVYYLKFQSESQSPQEAGPIDVKVSVIRGNSHMHFVMGLIALAIVIFFRFKLNSEDDLDPNRTNRPGKKKNEKGPLMGVMATLVFVAFFIYLEFTC